MYLETWGKRRWVRYHCSEIKTEQWSVMWYCCSDTQCSNRDKSGALQPSLIGYNCFFLGSIEILSPLSIICVFWQQQIWLLVVVLLIFFLLFLLISVVAKALWFILYGVFAFQISLVEQQSSFVPWIYAGICCAFKEDKPVMPHPAWTHAHSFV